MSMYSQALLSQGPSAKWQTNCNTFSSLANSSQTASACFFAIWKWYEREVHCRPWLWLWEIALTLQCLWEETTWHIPSRKSGQLWGGPRGPGSAFHIHAQGAPRRSGFSSAALWKQEFFFFLASFRLWEVSALTTCAAQRCPESQLK